MTTRAVSALNAFSYGDQVCRGLKVIGMVNMVIDMVHSALTVLDMGIAEYVAMRVEPRLRCRKLRMEMDRLGLADTAELEQCSFCWNMRMHVDRLGLAVVGELETRLCFRNMRIELARYAAAWTMGLHIIDELGSAVVAAG